MTVDQVVAIMGGLTALIGALVALLVQVRATHDLVNNRMTELLTLTRDSAHAAGVAQEATLHAAQTTPDTKEAP